MNPSSLSYWRKRIGEQGAELILQATIEAGIKSGAVRESSLERVSVDTTVQPKAITFPTDSKLYNRSRERLVKLAQTFGIELRQSYARLGPRALLKSGRYLHARQMKRARCQIKRLKTYLGRVYRDMLENWQAEAISGFSLHPNLRWHNSCYLRRGRARTSCTAFMPLRWSVSPKVRRIKSMSSA